MKVILNVTLGKASKTYSSQLFLKASLLPDNVCSHIRGLSSMAIWAQIYRSLETTFVLHFKQKIGSAMGSFHMNKILKRPDAKSFPSNDFKRYSPSSIAVMKSFSDSGVQ